jgi:pimeloyl-ACP methyl ester carboxylesterase
MADLSGGEQQRLGLFKRFQDDLAGYMQIQGTRPQTLAYGLHDSPVGQLAWIVEKFRERTDTIVHWSEFDRGGHFAAMEAPDLLTQDIRAFFRQLG